MRVRLGIPAIKTTSVVLTSPTSPPSLGKVTMVMRKKLFIRTDEEENKNSETLLEIQKNILKVQIFKNTPGKSGKY